MYYQTLPNTAASTQAEFSCTNYCALHENCISIALICKYWSALAQNTHLIIHSDILVQWIVLMLCLCLCVWYLILQAGAEDQIVILHFTILHHLHLFGLAVDGPHLTRHHADPGAQRQLGLILIAVAVTVEEQILHQSCAAMKRAARRTSVSFTVSSFRFSMLKVNWLIHWAAQNQGFVRKLWYGVSYQSFGSVDWIRCASHAEPLTDMIKQTFLLFITSARKWCFRWSRTKAAALKTLKYEGRISWEIKAVLKECHPKKSTFNRDLFIPSLLFVLLYTAKNEEVHYTAKNDFLTHYF